jgi:hypothetical protein
VTREMTPQSRVILCVTTAKEAHRHICSVGIRGTSEDPLKQMTVGAVFDAMAAGTVFYTYSPTTKKIATVRKARCPVSGCHTETIKSAPEAGPDNSLDELALCI